MNLTIARRCLIFLLGAAALAQTPYVHAQQVPSWLQSVQSVTKTFSHAADAAQSPASPTPSGAPSATSSPQAPATTQVAANMPSPSAGVFTPPSDAPPANAGPVDPSKMPQINDIHIGSSMEAAKAALAKLYPGRQIDALPGQTMGPQHQHWPQALRAMSDSNGTDETGVDVTYPPGPQVVWHVSRTAHQPNVAHGVLVAALRAKYGKESLALGNGWTDTPAADDSQITTMYWVYDVEGHQVMQPKILRHSPFGCGGPNNGDMANSYFALVRNADAVPPGYCRDAYIVLAASLPPTAVVSSMSFDMLDMGLAARNARATDAWSKGLDQKAQQDAHQQSQTVKPQL
jgi:hypothetical protein